MTGRTYSLIDAATEIGCSYMSLWVKSKQGKINGLIRFRKGNRNYISIPESTVLAMKAEYNACKRKFSGEEA